MKTGRDREREKEGRQKETIESKLARAPAPRVFPREPTSLSQACECHNRSQITDHRSQITEREKERKGGRDKDGKRKRERKRERERHRSLKARKSGGKRKGRRERAKERKREGETER